MFATSSSCTTFIKVPPCSVKNSVATKLIPRETTTKPNTMNTESDRNKGSSCTHTFANSSAAITDSLDRMEDLPEFRSASLSTVKQEQPLLQTEPGSKRSDLPSTNASFPVATGLLQIQTGWKYPHLTTVGLYYPLGPCQFRFPRDQLERVLRILQDAFRKLSMQVAYQDTPIVATCFSLDQVEFDVSIFESQTKNGEIIIEVDRRFGDAVSYHNYAQQLACAICGTSGNHPLSFTARPIPPYFWNKNLLCEADSIGRRVTKNRDDDSEILTEALETTSSLISNDRYDARRLGFLSLMHITDPYKSGLSISTVAAKCLLFPSDTTQANVSRRVFEYACGDHYDEEADTDSTIGDTSYVDSATGTGFAYLSLAIVSQVFQVAAETKLLDMESFLCEFSSNKNNNDLVECIMGKMHQANRYPHHAYYAVQSLVALCECIPSLRRRINTQDVEDVQLFGDSCHLALATASRKLLLALQP